ncbi:hypothetical protein THL1_4443 [Pseudomonas sp. TCU-HL1]|nr:hypothetical protein THL1_4443 [Pseudomonas sp. TCU-HL1]
MKKLNHTVSASNDNNIEKVRDRSDDIITPATVLVNSGDAHYIVDKRTGEILSAQYVFPPATQVSAADKKYYSTTTKPPEEINNESDLRDYLGLLVDGRMSKFDNLTSFHNQSSGEAVRSGGRRVFSAAHLKVMEQLAKILVYRNIVIGKTEDVAASLGTTKSNISAKLTPLENAGLLRFFTYPQDMIKGEIKILVNPAYIFKASKSGYAKRLSAIHGWYSKSFSAKGNEVLKALEQDALHNLEKHKLTHPPQTEAEFLAEIRRVDAYAMQDLDYNYATPRRKKINIAALDLTNLIPCPPTRGAA